MNRIEINVRTSERKVIPLTQEEIADAIAHSDVEKIEQADTAARASLKEIDLQSIRAIREYIAGLPNSPAALKTLNDAAVIERTKLRR